MNPAFLDSMSWEMAEVYGAISDQILINLAKYFPYYKPGATVPKSAFTYQAAMLAQMGQVNAETIQIIRNGLKDANKALSGVLEQAIIDSVSKAEKPLLKAVKMGVFSPPLTPIVAPNQMRAFKLYYEQAANKLNLVNTVMLESTQSAYQQAVNDVALNVQIAERIQATQTALDIGAGETVTGVSSWNQALRHSIDRMKANGITGFIDHAGRHWSAEAYAAMDIRTTVMNTARAAVWETNETFGNDLYLVSYHQGARPLCYDWQNKVISSLNNARDVVDLDGNTIHVYAQSDTTYGEPAGLFGINCKHTADPFIPGVSLIRGQPQSEEENAKTYAESQEQRRLERKLREEKRDVMIAKAQGAPQEEIDRLREKARKTSGDIDTFCEETGRARHRDREGVYTGRSFPSKDKYNVAEFERDQKRMMDNYFYNDELHRGGAQRGYTFGQMTPNAAETSAKTIEEEIEELKQQRSAISKKMRFDDSEELKARRDELTEKINAMYEKQANVGREEKEKELTLERTKAKEAEEKKRSAVIEKYNAKITELENERMNLIASGSDDYIKTDRLYAEIERLETKKKVVESGGYTIDEATVTRERVKTHWGAEIDADVYSMPDGMRFSFKRGMSSSHQSLAPEDLIDRYYTAPKQLRDAAQKEIIVVDRYNPADAQWRKAYKNFTHSYMTGGETITIYRYDYEHDLDYLEEALRHEMGHGLDRTNAVGETWFSGLQEWVDAMAKDKEFSGGVADSVSDYGKNSKSEDFAESVMKFTGSQAGFVAAFPNRAAILMRMIGGAN